MVKDQTSNRNGNGLLGVPKIDISPLILGRGTTEIQDVIGQISDACKNWGFFYVVGHQIEKELIQRMRIESAKFFHKPKEYKMLIPRGKDNSTGYFEAEYTKRQVDWKEGYDLEAFDGSLDKSGGLGLNMWPEGMPEFKAVIEEYFEEVRKLSLKLLGAMWTDLNGDKAFIEKHFGPNAHTTLFRVNYYRICPDPDAYLGVGNHKDAGVLTVLLQDEGLTALQVNRNGVWYDIPPIPDSFVINIGDMAQVFSNGIYQAPLHRVLVNKTSERFSFPFFFNPSYDTIIQPLEQCVTNETPLRYRPIKWGEFRRRRYAGDHADLGEEEIQITDFEIQP